MKILFLRVGIDRGCGGTLSPIFEDGSFEYVPIPEFSEVAPEKGLTYSDLPARSGGTLARFSGSTRLTHYDPEFETFTYGEPSEPKRSQLLRLAEDDYLVFYAGFQGGTVSAGTCFVIGYMQVKKVHPVLENDEWPPSSLKHLHNNAHFRRKNAERSLVVVEGKPSGSRLLVHATQLSDSAQKVLPHISEIIGIDGSVKRAIGRWVPEDRVNRAADWLLSLD